MTSTPRNNMWPLLIMGIGGVWLLMVVGTFPEAVGDILKRSWPALTFLFGVDVLLARRKLRLGRRRVDLSLVGVLLTIVILGGVVWFGYQHQADVLRTNHVETLNQTLPPDTGHLRVDLNLKRTGVVITPSVEDTRLVQAEYRGSRESVVTMDWTVEGDTAVLSVVETAPNSIPKLADYGRGILTLTLPGDAVIDTLALSGTRGDVSVDSRLLKIEQISLTVDSGNLALYLPMLDVLQGDLRTDDGGIDVYVPSGMALILKAQGGEPDLHYDSFRYDYLRDGTLKYKAGEPYQYSLDVWLKKGAPLTVTDLE